MVPGVSSGHLLALLTDVQKKNQKKNFSKLKNQSFHKTSQVAHLRIQPQSQPQPEDSNESDDELLDRLFAQEEKNAKRTLPKNIFRVFRKHEKDLDSDQISDFEDSPGKASSKPISPQSPFVDF